MCDKGLALGTPLVKFGGESCCLGRGVLRELEGSSRSLQWHSDVSPKLTRSSLALSLFCGAHGILVWRKAFHGKNGGTPLQFAATGED